MYFTDMNDLAAFAMREGDITEAANMMNRALNSMNNGEMFCLPSTDDPVTLAGSAAAINKAGMRHQSTPTNYSNNAIEIVTRPLLYTISASASKHDEEHLSSFELLRSPSNAFTIFNRLFIFYDNHKQVNKINPETFLPHVPAVVAYNFGLLYHRRALLEGAEKHFHMALDLYCLSIRLLDRNVLLGIYSCQFNLLGMALFNNMGHIYSHFCRRNETMQCREHMLSTFVKTDCTRLLTKDEYIFFYMNLLLTVQPSPKFAPAA